MLSDARDQGNQRGIGSIHHKVRRIVKPGYLFDEGSAGFGLRPRPAAAEERLGFRFARWRLDEQKGPENPASRRDDAAPVINN